MLCIGPDEAIDRDRLVLYRTKLSLVMLNRYPYTNGHLMVAPLRHTADMNSLSDEEMLDLFKVLQLSRNVVEKEASPRATTWGSTWGTQPAPGLTIIFTFTWSPGGTVTPTL
ncbi:HIT domain-containing protein [Geotalea toluenoxydans]|uniref:HIT domain-containing protein n=1 Tax=Geotalea toluenoxydans TaxID=421624 RepID=UPI003F71FDAE